MFTDTCDINAVQINMENDQLAGYVCFNALNQFFFYIFIWYPLSKKKVKKDYNAAISAKKKKWHKSKKSSIFKWFILSSGKMSVKFAS